VAVNRQAAIASAEKLVSKGKIDAAIKEYRKLVADNPNDASTLNRLGDLYARLDKIDDAVRLFSQIADRYTEDGFFVKAIAIYKKIIKLDPTRLAVYERLAELYHKQGLITEARTQYQVLVDYYLKHGNTAAAVGVLESMVRLEPEDPTPHVKLAELYRQLGTVDKELVEHRTIAELMVRRGRIDEATQVYARAIAAAPQDIAFITDAVLGLKDGGHTGAAAKLLAVAVEKNPQAEKIARLAGLGRRESEPAREELLRTRPLPVAPEPVAPPPGAESPREEVLWVDPDMIEDVAARSGPPAAPRPSAAEPEPEELVLELPDEGPLPEPEPESAAAGAEPWFAAEAGVEFELEIEGLDGGPSVPEEAPAAPSPPAAAPALPLELEGVVEEPPIDWSFEPEPELELELELPAPGAAPPSEPTAPSAPAGLDLEALERTSYEVVPEELPAGRRLEDLLAEAEVFGKYGLREKAHDRLREILQHDARHLGAVSLQIQLWLEEGRHDRVLPRAQALAELATAEKQPEIWRGLQGRLLKSGYRFEGDRLVAGPERKKPKKDSVSALLEDLVGFGAPAASKPKPKSAPSAPAFEALDRLAAEIARPAPPKPPAGKPPAPPPPVPPPRAAAPLKPPVVEPAPPPPAAPPASPPPPVAAPPQAAGADEGLAWLDRAPTPRGALKPVEESLFDDEEGFFDLAAELEQELSGDEATGGKSLLAPQEQSLEEIVEGFKKGVAESLSPEDYDTHFNLGIAYREMGLIDEAIGEFQIAAKDANYLVDCCSLLGACFLEKGLPELAVRWYQKGLAAPDLPEEATLGLLYDLGNLYLEIGESEKAHRTFVEIYGTNSNYRDVVAKLEELGGR